MASGPVETIRAAPVAFDKLPSTPWANLDEETWMGAREVDVMSLLTIFLGHHVMTQELGRVEVEMPFELEGSSRPWLKPDVAFVSYGRWPKGRAIPPDHAFPVVPDLVVEVVSPSNSANEVEEKIVEYLRAGVRLIWVIFPTTARIYVHDGSPIASVISRTGKLDGGAIIPGFSMVASRLFAFDPEPA